MKTNQIVKQLEKFQTNLYVRGSQGVEPAPPAILSKNLLLIRGLLVQMVDKVAEADLDYRRNKASRYHQFLVEGMSKSAAGDAVNMEQDLVEKKVNAEKLKNYIKFVDGLCTTVQSVLKQQSASDKNQY